MFQELALDYTDKQGMLYLLSGILDRGSHHVPFFRIAAALCPGKQPRRWFVTDAAAVGHVPVLEYCAQYDRLATSSAADAAAAAGNVHVLEYLSEKQRVDCTHRGADAAAAAGQIEVLRYLHRRQGVQCSWEAAEAAAERGDEQVLHVLYCMGHLSMHRTAQRLYAARVESVEAVEALLARGMELAESDAQYAAETGNIEVLRFLLQKGVPLTSACADAAAATGHIEVIRMLTSEGVFCTDLGADHAVTRGDLPMLLELEAHGLRSTHFAASDACRSGHLPVVEHLLENRGVVPDIYSMLSAADQGRYDLLDYLLRETPHFEQCNMCTSTSNDPLLEGRSAVDRFLISHNIFCGDPLGVIANARR